MKHPDGRRVLDQLIARADVLVENFRPGTLGRMGLGYADLARQRPDLVYCSISAFGQNGPRRNEPGYDAVMQGEGGLMSITGPPDGPAYRLGVAIVDIVSGMFSAYGIAVALLARERTGRGPGDPGRVESRGRHAGRRRCAGRAWAGSSAGVRTAPRVPRGLTGMFRQRHDPRAAGDSPVSACYRDRR